MWGSFEHYINVPLWQKVTGLNEMANTDYSSLISDDISQGFHYPAAVTIRGRKIPAYVFAHHYAHAAYTFFTSPYTEAGIISHDGGGGGYGYGSGLFFLAKATVCTRSHRTTYSLAKSTMPAASNSASIRVRQEN